MKNLFTFCLIILLVNVIILKASPLPKPSVRIFSTHVQDVDKEWTFFKQTRNKKYQNPIVEQQR